MVKLWILFFKPLVSFKIGSNWLIVLLTWIRFVFYQWRQKHCCFHIISKTFYNLKKYIHKKIIFYILIFSQKYNNTSCMFIYFHFLNWPRAIERKSQHSQCVISILSSVCLLLFCNYIHWFLLMFWNESLSSQSILYVESSYITLHIYNSPWAAYFNCHITAEQDAARTK